eukprot:TRINITY_DN5083_c0_g1_i3.p1 TRINITY_DN5083_c0_g1~~TRINITY_DN5083_c0_g1_i3.p1  ORF type:complete len:516 (-),score=104.73 TRINITY_DN5083_c0_g1_i3:198-1745(-)
MYAQYGVAQRGHEAFRGPPGLHTVEQQYGHHHAAGHVGYPPGAVGSPNPNQQPTPHHLSPPPGVLQGLPQQALARDPHPAPPAYYPSGAVQGYSQPAASERFSPASASQHHGASDGHCYVSRGLEVMASLGFDTSPTSGMEAHSPMAPQHQPQQMQNCIMGQSGFRTVSTPSAFGGAVSSTTPVTSAAGQQQPQQHLLPGQGCGLSFAELESKLSASWEQVARDSPTNAFGADASPCSALRASSDVAEHCLSEAASATASPAAGRPARRSLPAPLRPSAEVVMPALPLQPPAPIEAKPEQGLGSWPPVLKELKGHALFCPCCLTRSPCPFHDTGVRVQSYVVEPVVTAMPHAVTSGGATCSTTPAVASGNKPPPKRPAAQAKREAPTQSAAVEDLSTEATGSERGFGERTPTTDGYSDAGETSGRSRDVGGRIVSPPQLQQLMQQAKQGAGPSKAGGPSPNRRSRGGSGHPGAATGGGAAKNGPTASGGSGHHRPARQGRRSDVGLGSGDASRRS